MPQFQSAIIRSALVTGIEDELHVVGDSLSALGTPPWPEILASQHGLTVVNHAQPGATVKSARSQARAISPLQRSLVVVEIGGNDLLAFRSARSSSQSYVNCSRNWRGRGTRS